MTSLVSCDRQAPWLDDLKEEWPALALKYLSRINARTLSESTDPEQEIRYVDISSVNSRGTIGRIETLRFGDAPSRARRLVRHGDTIVSTVRTYLRAVAPIPEDDNNLVASTGFAVVSPKTQVLDPGFLSYWLRCNLFVDEVCARSVGVSYPATNASEVGSIPAPAPPLPIQKAIADFLDRKTAAIDALIEKKRRLLDLLAEKRSALVNRAVTKGLDPDVAMKDSGVPWIGEIPAHWDVKRLKFVSEFVTSGPRGWSQYYAEEGAVFLRIGNVSRDGIDLLLDDIQRVQPPPSSEGTRTLIMPNDLLITITADIGSVGVVPAGLGEAYVNQHTALVRIDPKAADARFVAYAAKSPWGRLHFDESMQGGTKVGLNLDDVRNMPFGAPSLSEQGRIARHLDDYCDATARVAHQIQRQIKKLQEYRQALITAAVTGKVDVAGEETG